MVIELKNVVASENTFAQISRYMGWVRQHISNGSPVLGLVISRGTDKQFDYTLRSGNLIQNLDLTELGFR